MNLSIKEIFISRDVIFHEDHFPFLKNHFEQAIDLFIQPINTWVYSIELTSFDATSYDPTYIINVDLGIADPLPQQSLVDLLEVDHNDSLPKFTTSSTFSQIQ